MVKNFESSCGYLRDSSKKNLFYCLVRLPEFLALTVNLPINCNKREWKESKIPKEEKIQQPSGEINSALRKVTALYSHFSSCPLASFPNGKKSSTELWHQPHKVNVVKESLTGRHQIRRQRTNQLYWHWTLCKYREAQNCLQKKDPVKERQKWISPNVERHNLVLLCSQSTSDLLCWELLVSQQSG